MTDFTDKNGTRVMDFQPEMGFETVLIRKKSGEITAKFYFEHALIDNETAMSRLSDEGIRLFESKMKEINA